jgi:hypothetical protein
MMLSLDGGGSAKRAGSRRNRWQKGSLRAKRRSDYLFNLQRLEQELALNVVPHDRALRLLS